MNDDAAPPSSCWRPGARLVYTAPMVSLFHRLVLPWIAVLALVAGSAVSAAVMAPDRADAAMVQLSLMGMTDDDLCGDPSGHDHRCAYCHLLPDTPMPAPEEVASVLMPFGAWHRARDLHRAAQARDHARSPRAPPAIV